MLDEAIKHLIFDVVLKMAARRVVLAVPFLGWPGVNALFLYVLERYARMFYEELRLHVSFQLIDHRVQGQKEDYEQAVSHLKQALESGKGVEDAKLQFKNTLRNLIQFNPAP